MSGDPIRLQVRPSDRDEPPTEVMSGRPDPVDMADALDGSLAARLRAKHEQIRQGTKEFPVPGWDGELVMVARLPDRALLADENLSNERLIAECTQKVIFRHEGEMREVPNGWVGVGQLMGLTEGDHVTVGQIISTVLDNELRLDGLGVDLTAWIMGRRSQLERVLGE
jgi:hypothetical protein